MSTSTLWSRQLTQSWLSKNWLARLLWPLSMVYAGLMATRTWGYRHGVFKVQRCTVPVVVVGNVVVGGAGKTPVVIGTVQHLIECGHVPGVISRGYGRQADGSQDTPLAVHAQSAASAVGDEPLLIHRATGVPVFVARNRFHAAQALLAAHPSTTVIVCDDGLQHLALHADVSIAVFDERGLGNGWLLPAGLLRERWPHGTGRKVDLVLHATPTAVGSGQPPPDHPVAAPPVTQQVFQAVKILATHAYNPGGQRLPLAELASQPGAALAGIAKPDVFFSMLRARGVHLSHTWPLPDHHLPDNAFHSKLSSLLQRGNVFLTEKDAVKLFPTSSAEVCHADDCGSPLPGGPPCAGASHGLWAVPLVLTIEPAFFAALDAKLSSRHGHQTA